MYSHLLYSFSRAQLNVCHSLISRFTHVSLSYVSSYISDLHASGYCNSLLNAQVSLQRSAYSPAVRLPVPWPACDRRPVRVAAGAALRRLRWRPPPPPGGVPRRMKRTNSLRYSRTPCRRRSVSGSPPPSPDRTRCTRSGQMDSPSSGRWPMSSGWGLWWRRWRAGCPALVWWRCRPQSPLRYRWVDAAAVGMETV